MTVRLLNLRHDTSDTNIKIKDLLVVFELRIDVELNDEPRIEN